VLWTNEYELYKAVPKAVEARTPLMYQPMNPLCKALPGLLLEPLQNCDHEIFIQHKTMALYSFLQKVKYMKVIWDRLKLCGAIITDFSTFLSFMDVSIT
jgi:hypothetical protein